MKILNVIIQKAGVIDNVESFIILDEADPITEQKLIEEAENLFEKWCMNNGFLEEYDESGELCSETIEDLKENGYWESRNYDSVSLVWSNINL